MKKISFQTQYTVGTRIGNGRYEINDMIQQGGMGTVYKAIDTSSNSEVAIKVPINALGNIDDYFKEKLKFEARFLPQIGDNKYIVKYVDYFKEDQLGRKDLPHLVMEFINGKTLNEYRQGVALNENKIKDILGEILEGVMYFHEKGLLHRDLSPNNVMIEANNENIIIIDFGTVKELVSGAGMLNQSLVRTSGFTAPEQAELGHCSYKGDIYMVGTLGYYLITGTAPNGTDLRPGLSNSSISDHLDNVIFNATRKKPRLRYSSALEMRNDLLGLKPPITLFFIEQNHVIDFNSDEILLGRILSVSGDHIQIIDTENIISRKHVKIIRSHNQLYLRDVGGANSNGTFLWKNDEWNRLNLNKEYAIYKNDVFSLGIVEKPEIKAPYLPIKVLNC